MQIIKRNGFITLVRASGLRTFVISDNQISFTKGESKVYFWFNKKTDVNTLVSSALNLSEKNVGMVKNGLGSFRLCIFKRKRRIVFQMLSETKDNSGKAEVVAEEIVSVSFLRQVYKYRSQKAAA